MFNPTISVVSRRSVLLVEETGEPGKNDRHVVSHWQSLSPNDVSSAPRLTGIRTHNVCGDRMRVISPRHYPG